MTSSTDPWQHMRAFTPARIALGRAGGSLPTREVLNFALAHAKARDAVHATVDWKRLVQALPARLGVPVEVESRAVDRAHYLSRPDFGRQLSPASVEKLAALADRPADLAIVIGDGLSASAIDAHGAALVAALLPRLDSLGLTLAPLVLARGARVALGDEIGARLGARAVAVLIGERPGLSSPDSLGIYFTLGPRAGLTDADRNCISNVRAEGLSYDLAAFKLAWLVREALRRGISGVALKDESGTLLEGGAPPMRLAP